MVGAGGEPAVCSVKEEGHLGEVRFDREDSLTTSAAIAGGIEASLRSFVERPPRLLDHGWIEIVAVRQWIVAGDVAGGLDAMWWVHVQKDRVESCCTGAFELGGEPMKAVRRSVGFAGEDQNLIEVSSNTPVASTETIEQDLEPIGMTLQVFFCLEHVNIGLGAGTFDETIRRPIVDEKEPVHTERSEVLEEVRQPR